MASTNQFGESIALDKKPPHFTFYSRYQGVSDRILEKHYLEYAIEGAFEKIDVLLFSEISGFNGDRAYNPRSFASEESFVVTPQDLTDEGVFSIEFAGEPITTQSLSINMSTEFGDDELYAYYEEFSSPFTSNCKVRLNAAGLVDDEEIGVQVRIPTSFDWRPRVRSVEVKDGTVMLYLDGYAFAPANNNDINNNTVFNIDLGTDDPVTTLTLLQQNSFFSEVLEGTELAEHKEYCLMHKAVQSVEILDCRSDGCDKGY